MSGKLRNRKTGFIIQARMNSSRLPGKVLIPLPFPGGQPIIKWIADQIKEKFTEANPVVATSNQQEDDKIMRFCKKNNILYFRGDEENVLSRFIFLAKQNNYHAIVRLTGDNPLLEIDFLEEVIERHYLDENDYSYTTGLPLGMNVEVVSARALLSLHSQKLADVYTEHVTYYFQKSRKYKTNKYRYKGEKYLKNLRLTVDYPSDFSALSLIMSLYDKNSLTGIKLVKKIYEHHSWIFQINKNNKQHQPEYRKMAERESGLD